MTAELLTGKQTAELLGMSKAQFYRMVPRLIANNGTMCIRVNGTRRYRRSVIEKAIAEASETGCDLVA